MTYLTTWTGKRCHMNVHQVLFNPYPASHTKIVGISTMLRDHDFFQSLRSHDQKKYGAGFLRNAAFRTCIESWGSPVKVLAESKVEVGELKYFLLF